MADPFDDVPADRPGARWAEQNRAEDTQIWVGLMPTAKPYKEIKTPPIWCNRLRNDATGAIVASSGSSSALNESFDVSLALSFALDLIAIVGCCSASSNHNSATETNESEDPDLK